MPSMPLRAPRRAPLLPFLLSIAACIVPPARETAHGAAAAEPHDLGTASAGAARWAGPDGGSETMVFLLMGQSNMEGAPKPAPEDETENPRVVVLAYDTCPNLGRTYDEWYVAKPPLHGCYAGVGPGDGFGKAMAAAYPNATIALVPLAVSGADIDLFRKGVVSTRRREFRIPPDNHWSGAYDWMIERARRAQRVGTIRGMVFHQGESDTGNAAWVAKVKGLVADLRADLGIGDAPFVAGELLYSGCCGRWHNPLVAQLSAQIPGTRVVSAEGLSGIDAAHFDLAGQREIGQRYATAMIALLHGPAPAAAAQGTGIEKDTQ